MMDPQRGRQNHHFLNESEEALAARVGRLDEKRHELVKRFVSELVVCYDPDVVSDFLELRRDPTLGSILQLAAAMSSEVREQLLFAAEELYSTEAGH